MKYWQDKKIYHSTHGVLMWLKTTKPWTPFLSPRSLGAIFQEFSPMDNYQFFDADLPLIHNGHISVSFFERLSTFEDIFRFWSESRVLLK